MSTPRPHEKWCKSMPREFDAAMGRGPYECDCGAEGVAAPLEPTTRDKDIEQLEQQRDRVGQEFGHVRWADAEKQPDGSYTAKLSGERFLAQQGFADSRNYSATELGPLLKAYAAAVSKNLENHIAEQNTHLARIAAALKVDFLSAKYVAEAAESRILELEKEITALRETK